MSERNGPMLRIRKLAKAFGPRVVLREVDIDVGQGETVVIIGASGSGKTTLLRCINFLEVPGSGSIELAGEPIGYVQSADGSRTLLVERRLAKQRERIGFVFQ